MRIQEELITRKKYLEETLSGAQCFLKTAPGGSLRANQKNGVSQYYIRTRPDDRKGTYVRKDEIPRAQAIAQRDYFRQLVPTAEEELAAINRLMEIMQSGTIEDIYGRLIIPRKQLVTPVAISNEEYAIQWLKRPYEKKGFDDDDPEIYTDSGQRVRSKSEALLFKEFESFSVPVKYEVPLRIWNGKIIHPDFDVLNVRTREEFRWEHFGKADDPKYMRYNVGRLNDLMLSGWFPGVNLIVTFETENKPLDMRVVRALIKRFLL